MDIQRITRVLQNYKVTKSGCWEYCGYVAWHGYGVVAFYDPNGDSHKLRRVRVHRLSYEQNIGPVPRGLVVCHHCDNKSCINPDHLFVGTMKDNIRDAIAKGIIKPRLMGKLAGRVIHAKALAKRGLIDSDIPPGMLLCSGCNEIKSVSSFYRRRNCARGYDYRCKLCE